MSVASSYNASRNFSAVAGVPDVSQHQERFTLGGNEFLPETLEHRGGRCRCLGGDVQPGGGSTVVLFGAAAHLASLGHLDHAGIA